VESCLHVDDFQKSVDGYVDNSGNSGTSEACDSPRIGRFRQNIGRLGMGWIKGMVVDRLIGMARRSMRKTGLGRW